MPYPSPQHVTSTNLFSVSIYLKVEIWLLPTQKPVKRQGWWKGKFILDASNGKVGVGVRGGRTPCPQSNSAPLPTISEQELFLRKRDTCRNSTVISDSHLEISHWWSDQCHLGCFKHSYSSVPRPICFCFLEADSPNVEAYVMAAAWSSRMCVCKQSCLTLCDPMKVHQVSLSMEFIRLEYWGGLPFLSPGDLPDSGIETASLVSPTLTGGFITTSAT